VVFPDFAGADLGKLFHPDKKGLVGLNPYQLGSLRMIFAAIFVLAIGFKTLPKIPLYKWRYMFAHGDARHVFSGLSFCDCRDTNRKFGHRNPQCTYAFQRLIIGCFCFGLQVNRNQLFGVIVGLMGSLLLVFTGEDTGTNSNYFYVFLVYIATLCYGTNVNIVKKYLPEFNSLTIAAGNALVTLGPALVILYFTGFFEVVHLPKVQHSMLFIMVLGIFGTGIANLLFYKLIQISSPVFATSVTYLIPIVAFFWGLLDNEMFSPLQFVGACVILFGVYLSGKK
jgi:drug/metabolite transporter (DMT)-like permease